MSVWMHVWAHLVSNRATFEVFDAAAFMGHVCHRTQMHLAQPGGLFAQWGPGPHQRQRFTSLHSREHHTEDSGSTSPSSSFIIPPD